MTSQKIKKRNGNIVEFDRERIFQAIGRAIESTTGTPNEELQFLICDDVLEELEIVYGDSEKVPTVEEVQDFVEKVLVESGNFDVAKHYILYRAEHAKKRAEERVLELEKIDKNLLKVTKRNGRKEVFKEAKLKKCFKRAAKGYEKICKFTDLYEIFKMTVVDGMKTDDIIRSLRKCAIDLISVENVSWQNIAGRLYAMEFYRKACRTRKMTEKDIYKPELFLKHFKSYMKKKLYYTKFLDFYSEEEILEAGKNINKERDFEYVYSTMIAFDRRYLLNPNGQFHELPQEMYMAVALFLAIPEPKETRLKTALEIYEVCSSQKLSLPTPTLLNARTNYHQLSSCFKLNADDDLRSIYHNIENMAQISKFGGGVGVYLGNIRSKGAAIRHVKNASGGVIPWVKVINDTACAVNQLGSRLGAISPTIDIWHRDIHDFLEMQTETGDIRSKAFDVFPAISVPDIFMKRVEENGDFTLFDPHEVAKVTGQKMQDLFCEDFEKFYLECEQNEKLELKETIPAKDLMKMILKTTVETGMPYFFFRDTVNRVNPNKHAGNIYATQLCTEICQNTSPSKFIEEVNDDGELSIKYKMGDSVVCNLASLNIAKVNTDSEITRVMKIATRVLDNVITLNFYPIKEAEYTAKRYRSVGIGFMGLAEYLACKGLAYDSAEAREDVDILFEKFAYATLENSNKLAQERGQYELFPGSEWSKGIIFGRDEAWYKKESKTNLDWSKLIKNMKTDGLRFSYHLSPAPNTSTSGVVGTTAGLLPIYKRLFVETNVIAPTVTVAPNLSKENFWFYKEYKNMAMPEVIEMFSVIYKWIDQSASFEWMMDPSQTSPADLYGYYMQAWKSNIKTVYYLRSLSGNIEHESCESCSG